MKSDIVSYFATQETLGGFFNDGSCCLLSNPVLSYLSGGLVIKRVCFLDKGTRVLSSLISFYHFLPFA